MDVLLQSEVVNKMSKRDVVVKKHRDVLMNGSKRLSTRLKKMYIGNLMLPINKMSSWLKLVIYPLNNQIVRGRNCLSKHLKLIISVPKHKSKHPLCVLPSFTGSSWYEFPKSEDWLLIDEVLSSSSGTHYMTLLSIKLFCWIEITEMKRDIK